MIRDRVEEILRYLDVDEKTRRYIETRVMPELERRDIESFDLIYSIVTERIDARQAYRERFFLRLNGEFEDGEQKIYKNPKTKEPADVLLECQDGRSPNSLSLDELREFLSEELSPRQLEVANYLLEKNDGSLKGKTYDGDLVLSRIEEIKSRLDATADRYEGTGLGVPRKRVVAVVFDPALHFRYERGYSDTVVREVYELLLQGVGSIVVSRLTGVSYSTVCKWKTDAKLPDVEISKIYPINIFSEKRLREAAGENMTVEEAAAFSGLRTNRVRGFWRKIGHNFITLEQEAKILEGINQGLTKCGIARFSGVEPSNLAGFIERRGLTISEKRQLVLHKNSVKMKRGPTKNQLEAIASTVKCLQEEYGRPITSGDLLETMEDRTVWSTATNRLKRAYRAGLLERTKGEGNRFLYSVKDKQERAGSMECVPA